MRKQTKIAAAVSAAALLALSASITSFAASRGTWMLQDGEWYCYDSHGDVFENTFCVSNGKDYYVGDDGMLVRSQWVEYDGDYYFVNSAGQKITNDWRLTTPYEDEDPAGSVNTAFNDGKDDSKMEDSFASLDDLLDYDENVVAGNAADMVYDN